MAILIRRGIIPPVTTVTGTTWNSSDKSTHITLSGTNNLKGTGDGTGGLNGVRANVSHATGKYYFELTITTDATHCEPGIANSSQDLDAGFLGDGTHNGVQYAPGGGIVEDNGVPFTNDSYTTGDVIAFALDLNNAFLWTRVNGGNWMGQGGVGDPVAGTNPYGYANPGFTAGVTNVFPFIGANTSSAMTGNFGPTYAQTKPSGYSDW